jgi:hypothetical protein
VIKVLVERRPHARADLEAGRTKLEALARATARAAPRARWIRESFVACTFFSIGTSFVERWEFVTAGTYWGVL